MAEVSERLKRIWGPGLIRAGAFKGTAESSAGPQLTRRQRLDAEDAEVDAQWKELKSKPPSAPSPFGREWTGGPIILDDK